MKRYLVLLLLILSSCTYDVKEYDVTRFQTKDDFVIIYTTEHKDRLVFDKYKVIFKHSNKLKLRCEYHLTGYNVILFCPISKENNYEKTILFSNN
jgi:lipopolysaccharide export system protein LptC